MLVLLFAMVINAFDLEPIMIRPSLQNVNDDTSLFLCTA